MKTKLNTKIAGKWLSALMISLVAITFTLDADAQRRFGGGKNLGRQSAPVQQRQATPPAQSPQTGSPQQAPATAAAQRPGAAPAAVAPRSPWRGALMGLAAGLGLAALASYLGFGEGLSMILTVLLLGMLVMMIAGFFLRRMRAGTPQPAYGATGRATPGRTAADTNAGSQDAYQHPAAQLPAQRSMSASSPVGSARPGSAMDQFARGDATASSGPWGIPAGFDTAAFLNAAKANYVKLQHAWDSGDLAELSEFTSNDMFIALTHELRARGGHSNTEVITLNADLLGIESTANEHIASVKFDGSLRVDGEIEPVSEVWNLAKPVRNGGWVLAGIQQLA